MAVYTAIDDAGIFFNPVLYTGTGSSLAVTGAGFQPDFTWIKNRDAADFHVLTDAVRGATKYWKSDSSAAEITDAESLKSFDSDGFTVGTQAEVNTNTEKYVSWNWKAGTTTGIAGSPSITPTGYSFNQTSGFSIIAYTGTGSAETVPHGLGKAPQMIIIKALDLGHDGIVYHEAIGNTYYLKIGTTEAKSNSYGTAAWNDTSPTTTVFSEGGNTHLGGSGNDYIAYCFADVQGYSKFGSYTGNGNADGPFIYTGFQPSFLMMKKTDTADSWVMIDTKRETAANYLVQRIRANTTAAEVTSDRTDILSNGFKQTDSDGELNGSGGEYIYMAFAEAPLVNSESVPVNAF